ncbi:MAG: hypothetical protein HKP12_02250 [Gammaproteobacteria bacterium]|nr:hypothetical protein [Gammaproteobacteria bacterium]
MAMLNPYFSPESWESAHYAPLWSEKRRYCYHLSEEIAGYAVRTANLQHSALYDCHPVCIEFDHHHI